MSPELFITLLVQKYNIHPEYLWQKFPQYAVFRHQDNSKWFAILMNILGEKIGLKTAEIVWIVHVKANPKMVGVLRMMKGIYPAYHMNKEHWISLNLAEVDEELLWILLAESVILTAKK